MGRIARKDLLYEGCFAHVFSRSVMKNKILRDGEDFIKFKELLAKVKNKGAFSIYHYCLMNTHFHMVVELGEVEAFSKSLKELKRAYTYWFNSKYKRVGPLWRERFRSMLIEDELYLSACGEYVEMNPVKAGLAERPALWPYSSSRYYFEGRNDDLIDSYDRAEHEGLIDVEQDDVFVKGFAVGSKLFNILLRQEVGRG